MEYRPACRRDWFEADWLNEKMDASPRKNRCIYLSKGRTFGPITQLVEYYTFNVGVVGSIPAWPIGILWVVGLPSGKTLIYRALAQSGFQSAPFGAARSQVRILHARLTKNRMLCRLVGLGRSAPAGKQWVRIPSEVTLNIDCSQYIHSVKGI